MDPDNAAVAFMSRATQIVATSCSIVEAVMGTAVLAITWHQPCDRELHLWVLVLIIRLVLRAALQRYIATQQENSEGEEDIGEWNKAQKAKECLDVFGLIWFTIGNAWVFSSQTCKWLALECCGFPNLSLTENEPCQARRLLRCCIIHLWLSLW
jgi:hypothetical protein